MKGKILKRACVLLAVLLVTFSNKAYKGDRQYGDGQREGYQAPEFPYKYTPVPPEHVSCRIKIQMRKYMHYLLSNKKGYLYNVNISQRVRSRWKDQIAQELQKGDIHSCMAPLAQEVEEVVFSTIEEWKNNKNARAFDKREIARLIDKNVVKSVAEYFNFERYSFPQLNAKEKAPFLLKSPSWPLQSMLYANTDLIQAEVGVMWASQAFSPKGSAHPLDEYIFGQPAIKVKDILLASSLISEQKVNVFGVTSTNPPTYNQASAQHYLNILADQLLTFDASTDIQRVNLNYIRHYKKGDVSCGLQVPIVRRHNHLALKSELRPETIAQLQSTSTFANFFKSYRTLEDFIEDVFSRKDIFYTKDSTVVGLGDIQTFINFEILSHRWKRGTVGGAVSFPSSQNRDTHKLWDTEVGNQGFMLCSIFGALLFESSRYFNPHFFVQVTVSPTARVDRRVPKVVTYNGISPAQPGQKIPGDFILFGEQLTFLQAFGPFPDSTARNCADRSERIKVHRGPELNIRVGNIIERFLTHQAFLDTWYELRVKQQDFLGFRPANYSFDDTVVKRNTNEVAHKLGIRYTYEFDSHWRATIDGQCTVAGRNVMKAYELAMSLQADF